VTVPLEWYLLLSAALFSTGVFGVLVRRNALVVLMSIELMLNAAAVNLVAFAYFYGDLTGQLFALFVVALAAAEVAIGIGLALALDRSLDSIDVRAAATARW